MLGIRKALVVDLGSFSLRITVLHPRGRIHMFQDLSLAAGLAYSCAQVLQNFFTIVCFGLFKIKRSVWLNEIDEPVFGCLKQFKESLELGVNG